MKKKGGVKKEVKNHGLKGPRCTGICPSNFLKKKMIKKVYCGKCIGNKKIGGKKEKNEKENSIV